MIQDTRSNNLAIIFFFSRADQILLNVLEKKKMMIALSNAQLSITIVKQTLHEVSVFQNL